MKTRRYPGRLLVCMLTVFSLAGPVPSARAAVDAGGPWWLGFVFAPPDSIFPCNAEFTQIGGTLSANTSSSCFLLPRLMTGSIDSATGAFTLSGVTDFFCNGQATLAGTVAPDGLTLKGNYTCPSFGGIPVEGSRCGNGVLDAGEGCDDGNRYGGDCCRGDCTPEPAGTRCNEFEPCQASTCDGAGTCDIIPVEGPCDDYNSCTTNDTCRDGACAGEGLPDGSACDDGDQCSTGDVCEDGWCEGAEPLDCPTCQTCDYFVGCVEGRSYACFPPTAGRSTVALRDDPRDRKDAVDWKLAPGYDVGVDEFGDPRSDTSYDLCVFENYGYGRLLAGLEVPAGGTCGGKPCWTPKRNGYRYADKSGANDGVRRVVLEAGKAGRAKLAVKAKGENVQIATLPASLPVIVQLQGSNGACWESSFFDARLNGPLEFRARTSGSPSGSFVSD